jgi:hypothetical protein
MKIPPNMTSVIYRSFAIIYHKDKKQASERIEAQCPTCIFRNRKSWILSPATPLPMNSNDELVRSRAQPMDCSGCPGISGGSGNCGIICDLGEGFAPYMPRYTLPDYEKLMREGCEYLRLPPPPASPKRSRRWKCSTAYSLHYAFPRIPGQA